MGTTGTDAYVQRTIAGADSVHNEDLPVIQEATSLEPNAAQESKVRHLCRIHNAGTDV